MKWVLDDGPLGVLAQHFDPGWLWPPGALEVVESVARGASQDRSGRRERLLALTNGGQLAVPVRAISLESRAAALVFEYLRSDETNARRDFGEDESIAYCMTEATDRVFVTMDKGAAVIALGELGGARVATAFDLWFWMAEQRMISESTRDSLCQSCLKHDRSLPGIPRRLLNER